MSSTTDKNKAVGYVRVSTGTQELSVEAQKQQILDYGKNNDLEIIQIIVDNGVSGGVPLLKREGGQKLESMIKAGVKAIISCKIDRLFRNLQDASFSIGRYNKQNIKLHLLDLDIDTSTSSGLLHFHMLCSVSEFEKSRIGERVKSVMEHKRSRGEATGGHRPFGFEKVTVDGTKMWGRVEGEQVIMKKVFEARDKGLSLRAIANYLNGEGYTTSKGKEFKATTIKRICETSKRLDEELKKLGR